MDSNIDKVNIDKVETILRHIVNVQQNCELLGKRLMERGEFELGKTLIANSLIHDNSKFFGIEFENLFNVNDPSKLEDAILHHSSTNPHHPEYWSGIENMPKIYLAEMIADWKARTSEFGTSLQEWIDNDAAIKFNYKKGDKTYKRIMYFVNLMCYNHI